MDNVLNQRINCLKDEPKPKQVIRVEISDISYTDNFNDDERQYARWEIYMSPIEHNLAQLVAYFYLDINEDGGTFGKKLTRWLKIFEEFADESDEDIDLTLKDMIGASITVQYTGRGNIYDLLEVRQVPALVSDIELEPGDTEIDGVLKKFTKDNRGE